MTISYALTIARCKIGKQVTKSDLITIRDRLFDDHSINLTSFPVHCYEYKKNKDLHYHATVLSQKWIMFKDIKYVGWSIKLKYLKTPYDIINWCGYICKHKVDDVDIKSSIVQCQKYKKDKKKLKMTLKRIPITDFLNMDHSDSESIESSQ